MTESVPARGGANDDLSGNPDSLSREEAVRALLTVQKASLRTVAALRATHRHPSKVAELVTKATTLQEATAEYLGVLLGHPPTDGAPK